MMETIIAVAIYIAITAIGFAVIIAKSSRNDNWSWYFGTPKSTASTLVNLGCKCPLIALGEQQSCENCQHEEDGLCGYRIVEWLEEEKKAE